MFDSAFILFHQHNICLLEQLVLSPVNFRSVSSRSQAHGADYSPEAPITDASIAAANGYLGSKWVAEQFVRIVSEERYLNANVIRVGLLTGNSSGAFDTAQWLPALIQSGPYLGCLPDGDDVCASQSRSEDHGSPSIAGDLVDPNRYRGGGNRRHANLHEYHSSRHPSTPDDMESRHGVTSYIARRVSSAVSGVASASESCRGLAVTCPKRSESSWLLQARTEPPPQARKAWD
jgi:hypothetical protein